MDAAVVPPVQGQPDAAPVVRLGLQAGKRPAPIGATPVGADVDVESLREKLIKIGAKVVRPANAVTFRRADVAVLRKPLAATVGRVGRPSAVLNPRVMVCRDWIGVE